MIYISAVTVLTQPQTRQIKFTVHHRPVVGVKIPRPGQTNFIAIRYFFFSDGFTAVALCFEVVAFAGDFPLETAARAKSVNIHTPSLMFYLNAGVFAKKQVTDVFGCAVTILDNV